MGILPGVRENAVSDMPPKHPRFPQREPVVGVGQVAMRPPGREILSPAEQLRVMHRLSDPMLSELDLEDLLDELLRRIQDALEVDTVAILLLDESTDELVARAARGLEEEVEQGVRIPLGKGFAGRIASERVPIFIEEVNHADILNPILREKGIRSIIGVPLIVEGDLVGVMHVASLTPRIFGERDLAVLWLAAARAAPAIERARLFAALEREHRVAEVLQRSLLPDRLVDIAGIGVAARYLPAKDRVGGDWYDVIELPRGLVGLVIGDVVGHGIRAAALMGQLRTALRSYAVVGHSPATTLELLDRFMDAIGEQAMATAVYAVFDTDTSTMRFSIAGHPPPVVFNGGPPRFVDVSPAAPLGALPFGTYAEHELTLNPGESLLLYTDGLIEWRGRPIQEGMNALLELVEGAESAEEACERVAEGLVPAEGLQDDVAIVALQNAVIPEGLDMRLPADPKVLSSVRRVLRRWLRERGVDPADIPRITLAVNEACANAVEHAYSPMPAAFEVIAGVSGDELTITVRDAGQWRAPRGTHRGRGLTIMDAAMDDVRVEPEVEGTAVVMRRRLVRPA
jgi:anti-sigma regulatory factor (Ser/Thr protein kinase)/putative methionine-R-sulfoxide reductase with GAF domain